MSIHPAFRARRARSLRGGLPAILLLAALLALTVSLPAAAQIQPQQEDALAAISPHLESQLAAGNEPVSFLVVLDDQVDAKAALQAAEFAAAEPLDRTARATELYHTLTRRALASQAPLRAWLDAHGVAYRPFYIVNMIEVRGDAAIAQALRGFAEVDRLAANPFVFSQETAGLQRSAHFLSSHTFLQGQEAAPASRMTTTQLPYGLVYTRAPQVWDLGFRGQGIVVASQDTGVQWDHTALKASYRGWNVQQAQANHVYNWYDVWGEDSCTTDPQIPCDDSGHGTHTVGTMTGDATADGLAIIGMAPGAQWIGCRNMLDGWGTPASYAACFEFMLAPYPQDGDPFTDGKPELAPHIINNSWGCPPSEGCDIDSLRRVVETARSAGQVVVASAGNNGPACSTVQFPISMYAAAFSIGAHNSDGLLAGFSSRGPVTADGSGRLKPELTAPGVFVFSSVPYNNYDSYSGTSMASPHTAGAIALLWSAAPELIGNVDLTEQVLVKSATPVLDSQCLPSATPVSPNPAYGYGLLDIYAAVEMALTPWQAVVKVTNATDDPQDQINVVLVDQLTGYTYRTSTGFNGLARIPLLYYGTYSLRIGEGADLLVIDGIRVEAGSEPVEGTGTDAQWKAAYRIERRTDVFFPSDRLFLPSVVRN